VITLYFSFCTAEPGQQASDICVCAYGYRDTGRLGGLSQYWWVDVM